MKIAAALLAILLLGGCEHRLGQAFGSAPGYDSSAGGADRRTYVSQEEYDLMTPEERKAKNAVVGAPTSDEPNSPQPSPIDSDELRKASAAAKGGD